MAGCWICEENERQASGNCEGAVARLSTGWVRLNRVQYYRGAAFFVADRCVREVYNLDADERSRHLFEMAEVASAMDVVFRPRKMNIESLGNGVPHVHWWITPRHDDDPRPNAPIWEDPDFLAKQWDESNAEAAVELSNDATRLRNELARRGHVV